MGIIIKFTKRQTLIPPGEYPAKVMDIKQGSFNGKRKTLEFIFEVVSGDYYGATMRGFVNAHYDSYSEHTKLRKWISAISNENQDIGELIDLDVFYKKILKVRVDTKSSRKTKNEFSNVTEILGVVLDEV